MGKILVKASPQTMIDSQGNVQFLYGGGEGRKGTIPARLAAYLGKIAGGALGATAPHKNLMSLISGIQSGAATGEQAGRSLIDSNPITIAYRALMDRANRPSAEDVYREEYGKEKRRQQIRRDVSRELKPQTQEQMMRQLLEETGNPPAMAQRLVNYFNQGTEVQHNTANSAAAQTPMPPLQNMREQETTVTNTGANFDNKTGVAAGHEPVTSNLEGMVDEQGNIRTSEEIREMLARNAEEAGRNAVTEGALA